MIKINNPDIKFISAYYFSKIKEECLRRASFYITVFDVLFNGTHHNTLESHPLHGTSKKSLLNLFLRTGHKLQDQTHYHTTTPANCEPWVTAKRVVFEQLCNYLNNENNLKEIILCEPEDCFALDAHLMGHFGLTINGNVEEVSLIRKILDYDSHEKYAYQIGKLIGINTCPYCNRIYIHTVYDSQRREIIRPEFDHFYPQKFHPFLALSFFNLIPSCYYCNSSLKTATAITPTTNLHPFIEGYDNDVFFHVSIKHVKKKKSDPDNYKIKLLSSATISLDKKRKIFGNSPAEGNLNLFKLNEIYPSHLDIVGELVVKCQKYSTWYSGPLLRLFGMLLSTNKGDFYQFYFGNYFNETDFHRRPLAKMTKDVVRQVLPEFMK